MARPRKPTALKKLRGTLRKCRVNPNEWTPPVGAPEMPASFKHDARREWLRVVPMLLDAGLISHYDGSTLEAYCEAYQEWKDAARTVAKEGQLIAGGVHPAMKIVIASREQCMKYAQRFGLDPQSRSKISAPKKEQKDATKDFLLGGGILQVVK
ncbi:MAG: phage terminase small subunit P27 family [Nitrosomonas sp.]